MPAGWGCPPIQICAEHGSCHGSVRVLSKGSYLLVGKGNALDDVPLLGNEFPLSNEIANRGSLAAGALF